MKRPCKDLGLVTSSNSAPNHFRIAVAATDSDTDRSCRTLWHVPRVSRNKGPANPQQLWPAELSMERTLLKYTLQITLLTKKICTRSEEHTSELQSLRHL